MASKSSYQFIFVPILGLVLLATVAFFGVFITAVTKATVEDPQTVAGAAQIAHVATPAGQLASVTTDAKPLAPSEEARKEVGTEPGDQPAGSPSRAPQQYPNSPAR